MTLLWRARGIGSRKEERAANMLNRIKALFQGGFFHILSSSLLNKCITFVSNIFLVRLLTKNDYGVFTGAFNAYFIVFLFSGFGITSGMLYACSKNISREEKNTYYRYCFRFGLISEFFLSAALVIYGVFGDVGIEETRNYIISLAGLPFIAFLFDYFSIILRAERSNKKYSYLLNIHSACYAAFALLGALAGGIAGTIAGRYLSYVVGAVIGCLFCREFVDLGWKEPLGKEKTADLTKYSLKAGVTSALNVILYRIDVMVITIVVADASILAAYKTGTQLPENLNFIPQCMMVYYIPLFVQHLADVQWIKQKTKEIYLFVGGVSIAIGLVIYLFAPLIVTILWGENYLDAVPCMRILTLSFVILSTFRITSTNILLSLKRAGYTMMISIITGVTNIGLDVLLTVRYGSIGAAYATLIVTILAAVLSFPYVLYIVYSGKQKYE